MSLDAELQAALAQRKRRQLYRQRRLVSSPCNAQVISNGKHLLSFCSNNYLGLANHPNVIEAMQQAAKHYGVGSGASHLICGHSTIHHDLEAALADFTGRDRALLFSTGFMANSGIIQALLGKGDAVFEDRLNHASLIDAGLHSAASFSRYRHNDMNNLQNKLEQTNARRKLIVADAVFSMDGDCVPLAQMQALAATHQAHIMLDDAHGFGVLNNGKGFAATSQQKLPVYMATLGKAIGVFGAFVAGSEALIETLIQFARSYIYTTALPPAVAAASLAALQTLQAESWRHNNLQARIQQFRTGAAALPIRLMLSDTAIQPLLIGDPAQALAAAAALEAKGFLVAAIRPPTVPPNSARLRVTLTAAHTQAQVDSLLNALGDVLP